MAAAVECQPGSWAAGDPAQNAAAFLKEHRKHYRQLGSTQYFAYVQALGCAYAHAALMRLSLGADRAGPVRNTLRTAEAIVEGTCGDARELDSEDDDEFEDDGGQEGADRVPILRQVMRVMQLLQDAEGVVGEATSSSSNSAPAAAAAAAGPWGPGSNTSPLPPDVLLSIVTRLDAATRARAAASCKRLQWAVDEVETFAAASPALAGFLEALQLFRASDGGWGDGSYETEWALTCPPDGTSAVAGFDLHTASSVGELARVAPFMGELFEALAGIGGGGFPGGREGMMARVQEYMADARGKVADKKRAPPHPKSSPLAAFVASEPVSYTVSSATQGPGGPGSSSISSSQGGASATAPPAAAAAAAAAASGTRSSAGSSTQPLPPAAATDLITSACCNVYDLYRVCASPLHLDGNLLALGYRCGWKERDPGLGGIYLDHDSEDGEWSLGADVHEYDGHGLFSYVTKVCADAGNALIWCAADNGHRIKAFRAPEGAAPLNTAAAACNRGQPNGLELQYTLCTKVPGTGGDVAGLHVTGTRVMAVKGSGRLCVWDIADLAPAAEERMVQGWDSDAPPSAADDEYYGDIGWRCDDHLELEVTKGVAPNVGLYQLQAPTWPTAGSIQETCMLLPPSGSSGLSLVAAYGSGLLVVHDLATGQAMQQYLGHLFDVTDICAAPAAWQQAALFATSGASGDVKLWDLRSRLGVPALTLGNPRASALQAVALAAATTSSSGVGSSSSSSSQLGGGMLCFTGGANESVWCFDLRRGQGQALYELSTGNTCVEQLAWHEGSNTLYAACEGRQEDRMGYCHEEFMVIVAEAWPPGAAPPPPEYAEGADPSELYWPRRGAHSADHFSRYYNQTSNGLLAYRFSATADREVPYNMPPQFRDGGW